MYDIVVKYESLVEDGQWGIKSEKNVDILSLTSQIQKLKILFPKQSTSQYRSKNNNDGNKIVNNGGSSWKKISPISGEYWTKEKNGRTWHWCEWHEYWTTMKFLSNLRMQHNNTTNKTDSTKSSGKKSLKINLEYLEGDSTTGDIFGVTTSVETNYHIASDKIDIIFDVNVIDCTEVKHSISDDSEKLKDQGGRINPPIVPTRFQYIQRDQHSSQR